MNAHSTARHSHSDDHRGQLISYVINNSDKERECKLSSRHLPTYCQKDEKLFRATQLKAASHHIPTGRCKLYMQQFPAEILAIMAERDDLRKQDPASPRLSTMNDAITKATSDHKKRQWREFIESIDHRTDRAPSCGVPPKELTANPSRRQRMRVS